MPRRTSDPQHHLSTDHLYGDLAGRTIRGGAVTVLAQLVKVVAQMAALMLLGRLLAPQAFGLIAMTAVVIGFLEFFKDLGLTAATVQRPHVTQAEISTLFWVNSALGCGAGVVAALLGPLLARLYGEEAVAGIAVWLGVGLALSGVGAQHLALLRRQMRFGTLAAIQLGAEIGALASAVVAAWYGAGVWALVVQRLVWAALMSAGAWACCGWRPGLPAWSAEIRAMLRFGGNLTGSNLLSISARHLDHFLIGWYWGATALGFYERSYKILQMPIATLNTPLYAVVMPTLSRLADQPERYRAAYVGTLEKLLVVTMPLAALLIVAPDLVLRVLLGPQWGAAAPILAWLGVVALYYPAGYTMSWLFTSQDRTGEMLRWGIIGSTLRTIAVVAGLPFGAEGVAASLALSGLIVRTPLGVYMVGRRGPVSSRDFYRATRPAVGASIVALAAVWASRQAAPVAAMGPFAALAALAGLAVVTTLISLVALSDGRRLLRSTLAAAALLRRRTV